MSASTATLIFPHQLFRDHPAVTDGRPVYLVEEDLYFNQFPFHKKKIQLHRASMKAYAAFLNPRTEVRYIEATSPEADLRRLVKRLGDGGMKELHLADPVDDWLQRRLTRSCAAAGITVTVYPTPNFLNRMEEVNAFFDERQKTGKGKNSKTYFQADFYMAQRKQRHWLMDENGKPEGGKWSFDQENRKRLPAGQVLPVMPFPKANPYVKEAAAYVAKHFPDNFGDLSPLPGGGFYPVTFAEADAWLDRFIEERLAAFGPFEDAMKKSAHFLFHSVLTPMLNTGLLDPGGIIRKTLQTADEKKIPLASLEGFLRQVMGWREFIRIVYEREGPKQRTGNFWGFSRKIPYSFWMGTTGIEPVDAVIRKISSTGYAHHIERLMVLGNFMLLCEFDPDEVYKWFMEVFIDSYDWVMVPNIYGMTQFADGGLMTTKPYLSGSNYLLKMGDWAKGPWEQTWNGLFWRFLHVNREFFYQHPRWKMLIGKWDSMPAATRENHLRLADAFLTGLDKPLAPGNDAGQPAIPVLF